MRNDRVLGWFRGWQTTMKPMKTWSSQVFGSQIHRKANQNNNSNEMKRQRKGQNPGCYKPSPLKKCCPQDLVAEGWSRYFWLKEVVSNSGFLYSVPTGFHQTDCLAPGWFASQHRTFWLTSYAQVHTGSKLSFISVDLAEVQKIIITDMRVLFNSHSQWRYYYFI